MKAIHFGAGNIGRGFIGYLLAKSGYRVTFVDIAASLVEDINKYGRYKVITLSTSKSEEEIQNVSAIHLDDVEELKKEVIKTDLITLSIGVNNLKRTGKLIHTLLYERFQKNADQPLDIIACENALFATDILKEAILEEADEEFSSYLMNKVGFPNSAVDRIVPNVNIEKELPIDVAVEDFFEWDIESNKVLVNSSITGADYVENLEPYLERKLFLLNGAHAATAYIGYRKGYQFVHEAIKDKFIRDTVIDFHMEAIEALNKKHGLDAKKLKEYSKKLIGRFENEYLQDVLYRVGRDPKRKLSSGDRLVSPLLLCRKYQIECKSIILAIAAGFAFDFTGDTAAMEIQDKITGQGIIKTISLVTGLDKEDTLTDDIAQAYQSILKL